MGKGNDECRTVRIHFTDIISLHFSGLVIYYNYTVPENERHDSAVKRNREALTTEVKLWEEYLGKVNATPSNTPDKGETGRCCCLLSFQRLGEKMDPTHTPV